MITARRPAVLLYALLLAGTAMYFGAEQMAYLRTYPGAWFFSLLLLAAVAIPAAVIIYRFDQFEPEPPSLILMAVVWGGVISLTFAALCNSYLLTFLQGFLSTRTIQTWGAAIVAPINEEFYKGAGLVLLYLMVKDEINGLMDGLVYGAMIGLGFQVVENVQYFLGAASDAQGGQIGAVAATYFVRVLVAGLYSHMLFTGLMGFGFAYAVTQRSASWARRFGVLATFVALAWAAHFIWNSPWLDSLTSESVGSFVLVVLIKGIPFLMLLTILAVFARRRERQAFERLIAAEVGTDVLSEEELRTLERGRGRRRAQREMRKRRGPAARLLLKQLQREQMNLALIHGRVAAMGDARLEEQRDRVRALKARLVELG